MYSRTVLAGTAGWATEDGLPRTCTGNLHPIYRPGLGGRRGAGQGPCLGSTGELETWGEAGDGVAQPGVLGAGLNPKKSLRTV